MARSAFQFPGQGSQYVGMGLSFHEASPRARELFAQANAILGFDLTSLCFSGPDAELRRTENAQPALFTVAAIACALLCERGIAPVAVAGHSVGEYAALFAAGSLSFEDGLRAVRRRGEIMARATEETPGTMAAIIGVPLDVVEALCDRASPSGIVDIANENGPAQTVISGELAAVDRLMDLVEEEHDGALAVPLAVAGAFHSRLMAPAAVQMAAVLADLPLGASRIPVVANVSGDVVRTPQDIRDALARQVAGRVRWSTSVPRLASLGAEQLIEAGPGHTLTRLARELVPELTLLAAEDVLAAAPAGGA